MASPEEQGREEAADEGADTPTTSVAMMADAVPARHQEVASPPMTRPVTSHARMIVSVMPISLHEYGKTGYPEDPGILTHGGYRRRRTRRSALATSAASVASPAGPSAGAAWRRPCPGRGVPRAASRGPSLTRRQSRHSTWSSRLIRCRLPQRAHDWKLRRPAGPPLARRADEHQVLARHAPLPRARPALGVGLPRTASIAGHRHAPTTPALGATPARRALCGSRRRRAPAGSG